MQTPAKTVQIDQDQINTVAHSRLLAALFQRVLGMSPGDCLLTDLSSLSDFVGQGMPEPENAAQLSYPGYVALWDQWVIGRVKAEFGITLDNTTITFLQVVDRLQKNAERTVH